MAVSLISLKAQILAYKEIYIVAAIVVGIGAFSIFLIRRNDNDGKKPPKISEEDLALAEA
jgi:hypothetical protein